jgi:hypothetical protein
MAVKEKIYCVIDVGGVDAVAKISPALYALRIPLVGRGVCSGRS